MKIYRVIFHAFSGPANFHILPRYLTACRVSGKDHTQRIIENLRFKRNSLISNFIEISKRLTTCRFTFVPLGFPSKMKYF